MRADYEDIIRKLKLTIKKLRRERDEFSFSHKEITKQWMEVFEDIQREHKKETGKLKRIIAELLDMIVSLKTGMRNRMKKGKLSFFSSARNVVCFSKSVVKSQIAVMVVGIE